MAKVTAKYFDLTVLLKSKVIDIKNLSITKPRLYVSELFEMLSTFLNLAPYSKTALKRFSESHGRETDLGILKSLILLLENLGCDAFAKEFIYIEENLINSDNWKIAAANAVYVTGAFSRFHSKISEARTKKRPAHFPDHDITLQQYLMLLEGTDKKQIILAIDDSPVTLNTLSSLLGRNYSVYTLRKSVEVKKVLQKMTPDLILLDYKMPKINGFELIPMIRNCKKNENTPIIMVTSEGTFENIKTAMELGVCDFVVKPFNSDALQMKVAKHIRKKKPA